MVWAGTHYLVGGGFGLVVAALAGIEDGTATIAFVSGLWALLPDIHWLVYKLGLPGRDRVRRLHDSHWADLCWFHYSLDQSWFNGHRVGEVIGLALAVVWVAAAIIGYAILVGAVP